MKFSCNLLFLLLLLSPVLYAMDTWENEYRSLIGDECYREAALHLIATSNLKVKAATDELLRQREHKKYNRKFCRPSLKDLSYFIFIEESSAKNLFNIYNNMDEQYAEEKAYLLVMSSNRGDKDAKALLEKLQQSPRYENPPKNTIYYYLSIANKGIDDQTETISAVALYEKERTEPFPLLLEKSSKYSRPKIYSIEEYIKDAVAIETAESQKYQAEKKLNSRFREEREEARRQIELEAKQGVPIACYVWGLILTNALFLTDDLQKREDRWTLAVCYLAKALEEGMILAEYQIGFLWTLKKDSPEVVDEGMKLLSEVKSLGFMYIIMQDCLVKSSYEKFSFSIDRYCSLCCSFLIKSMVRPSFATAARDCARAVSLVDAARGFELEGLCLALGDRDGRKLSLLEEKFTSAALMGNMVIRKKAPEDASKGLSEIYRLWLMKKEEAQYDKSQEDTKVKVPAEEKRRPKRRIPQPDLLAPCAAISAMTLRMPEEILSPEEQYDRLFQAARSGDSYAQLSLSLHHSSQGDEGKSLYYYFQSIKQVDDNCEWLTKARNRLEEMGYDINSKKNPYQQDLGLDPDAKYRSSDKNVFNPYLPTWQADQEPQPVLASKSDVEPDAPAIVFAFGHTYVKDHKKLLSDDEQKIVEGIIAEGLERRLNRLEGFEEWKVYKAYVPVGNINNAARVIYWVNEAKSFVLLLHIYKKNKKQNLSDQDKKSILGFLQCYQK